MEMDEKIDMRKREKMFSYKNFIREERTLKIRSNYLPLLKLYTFQYFSASLQFAAMIKIT